MKPEARKARVRRYAARRARQGLGLPYDRTYATGNCGVYSKGRWMATLAATRMLRRAWRKGASVIYLSEVDGVDVRRIARRRGDRWHVHQPTGTVGNCAVLVRKDHGRIVGRRYVQLSNASREGMWKVPTPVGPRYAVIADAIWDEGAPQEVAETLVALHLSPERTPLARAAGAARARLIKGRKSGDTNLHGRAQRILGPGVSVDLLRLTMPPWWPRTVEAGDRLFSDPNEHRTLFATVRFGNPRPDPAKETP